MPRCRFVHAADLHLDTPFACSAADSPAVAEALREATFQAWNRVVSAAIDNEAAFLLIAGDVFDAAQKSLRAQLRFRDGLERLDQHSIPVFVAHGNHDPLDSLPASLPLPPNTCIFTAEVESCEIRRRDGELVAMVAGVSHPRKNEQRNLARLFPAVNPPAAPDVLHVAVLHANVGAETGHDPYAPCELEDLTGAGYHYWALGHAHERRILSRTPWVVYSGNTQGRSLREPGPRGCFLVEADGPEILGEPVLIETDAVRWLSADVNVEPFSSTHELLDRLLEECRRLQESAGGRPCVVRLALRGRSPLYRELRRPGDAAALEDELRDRTSAWTPFVRVAALDFGLSPALDLHALRVSPGLVGELLRASEELRPEEAARVLEPLLEDPRFNRYKLRSAFETADFRDLAAQAAGLCADLLSPEERE